MSLTAAIARTALANIIAAHTGAVVSVTKGAQTADALLSSSDFRGRTDGFGEGGATVRTFWVDASQLDRPDAGETIMVGGSPAVVSATKFDPMGALLRVDFVDAAEIGGT